MWKPHKGRDDAELRARLKQLAERYPRYGYPTLHDMLRAEGLAGREQHWTGTLVRHHA